MSKYVRNFSRLPCTHLHWVEPRFRAIWGLNSLPNWRKEQRLRLTFLPSGDFWSDLLLGLLFGWDFPLVLLGFFPFALDSFTGLSVNCDSLAAWISVNCEPLESWIALLESLSLFNMTDCASDSGWIWVSFSLSTASYSFSKTSASLSTSFMSGLIGDFDAARAWIQFDHMITI